MIFRIVDFILFVAGVSLGAIFLVVIMVVLGFLVLIFAIGAPLTIAFFYCSSKLEEIERKSIASHEVESKEAN